MRSTASSPASTPSTPSKRPPFGTESRCEPTQTSPASRSVAGETSEEVSVGVDLDGETGLAEPARDEVVRLLLARAPADTIRAGARADRVDLLDPLENPQGPSLAWC